MKKIYSVAFALCLFLIIVGAKWATFDRFGSPMPDWDQWDAEAANLFIPWFEHDHFVRHLFQPHNEHRVVLTKLQNLTLTLLNGQWDSRLEASSNALLHAALAVAFWILACRWTAPSQEADRVSGRTGGRSNTQAMPFSAGRSALLSGFLFALTAVIFGFPLAWQNILGGFHSQQYWLLGLSFAAIVTLPFARTWSGEWWLGAIAGTLALGSMGSGFLAAVVVLGLIGWQMWRQGRPWRSAWPTIILSLALIAIGWLTRVEVYYHQQLKAKTAHDFIFSILRSLEWPLRDHDWTGIILWLPWLAVAGCMIRGWKTRSSSVGTSPRTGSIASDQRALQAIAALGAWVLVQIVATAYARGAGADYPASRYMDTLAFGAIVNVAALAWLLSRAGIARGRRFAAGLLAVAWLVPFGLGIRDTLDRNLRHELPDTKRYYTNAERYMRRYLATNDPKYFVYPDIPYPSVDGLVERLSHPSVRALMPLPIRTPLPLAYAGGNSGFLENDARTADLEHPPRMGLSPATAPLDATKSWGSFATGPNETAFWKSQPIAPSSFTWLKLETAGQPDSAGVTLEIRSAKTDALLAKVRPTKVPGDAWRAAYVRSPHEPFVIVARDQSATAWLAFSPPVEMGALSFWAWQATKQGLLVLYVGVGLMVFLVTSALLSSLRTR